MDVNTYVVADSFEQAYQLLLDDRKNKVLGGGAWLKISVKDVNHLISLEKLDIDGIQVSKESIVIGALTPLREIEVNQDIRSEQSGILSQAISKIMGVTVRNLATIGGSVMGRFSFSDILPVLLVLDAKLMFHKNGEVPVEAFLKDRTYLQDILKSVVIPRKKAQGYFKKVSLTSLDFAIVNLAIIKGDSIRIAVGSRPGIAQLAFEAMTYLNQQSSFDEETIEKAAQMAVKELGLGNNIRASQSYRETLVMTYIMRGLKQVI